MTKVAHEMSRVTPEALIKTFDLEPHPEGGYFRETYRAEGLISHKFLPDTFNGARHYSTAILYLLTTGAKSRLHRIASDEVWHFYMGDPLTIVQLHPTGSVESVVLGHDILAEQRLQIIIPAGTWFGAYLNKGSQYSFVGCTVSPGFDFADFELGKREQLMKQFPHAQELIDMLTD
jgi:uncharacterized protein